MEWKTIVKELVTNTKVLMIVLGAVFFVIGMSGGISYVPVVDRFNQIALAAFGGTLCIIGVILEILEVAGAISRRKFGIQIRSPISEAEVPAKVKVSGTVSKMIPDDRQLWLVRIYPNGRWYAMDEVRPKEGAKDWTKIVDIGGSPGEERDIAAYVIGPIGQAFIAYQRQAAEVHNRLAKMHKIPDNVDDRYLPAFEAGSLKILDMIRCDTVTLKRV
jgi:hypothetical protein